MTSKDRYRIGVDIGGTFTDFTVIDDATGRVLIDKMLTTPRAPEAAVMLGIERLAAALPGLLPECSAVIHATTLVTNVILERKGARVGLLTTAGFRDVLEMAREVRYDLFDMFIRMPAPLVPRERRLAADERTLADGSILRPLDEASVRAAAARFRAERVEAIAVCFLHSYRNASHEQLAARILNEELPEVALSLSHEVHPEPKEYERASTTVVDAYVKRVMERYLDRLAADLANRGYRERLYVMLSNGGTASVETAKRVPVQVVESGPAAGVEAAAFFAKLTGLAHVLAFDMGGTTAKLCIVNHGRAARTREFEVDRVHRFKAGSGLPIAVPVYDLLEIGAGGGSIACVDSLGLLQVGPASAGSEPGPACYGRGGNLPTVTDADLMLGYLNPDYFLGGEMKLNAADAIAAITTHVASPASLDPVSAAAGIYEIVNETMASAARMYVAEKAMAPSELTLIAFGGAGPVHAIGLARKLGCPKVVIPPHSGVMSSLGLLTAPIAFERAKAVRRLVRDVDLAAIEADFLALEHEARSSLPEPSRATIERTVDLRYSGQDYSLEIAVNAPATHDSARHTWQKDFLASYQELYGKVDDDNPIELASLRVYARQHATAPRIIAPEAIEPARPKSSRNVFLMQTKAFVSSPVFEREALKVGQIIEGPAVIEERMSTTVIDSGDALTVDTTGCLVITLTAAIAAGGRDATQQAVVA
ncbi:MAG: hydantoinase/oxoprolinase family protein [Burkholderiales bacterium]